MPVYEPTDFQAEVKILLDLADNPRHDVKTTTQGPRLAVTVPDYLLKRYEEYKALKSSPPEVPKKRSSKP